MKLVSVYKKGKFLYIHPSSKTTDGLWIAVSPHIRIESESEPSVKGEVVLRALGGSQDGVSPPTNWSSIVGPLLDLAGVKSWATFMRNSGLVNLELDGDGIKLIPNRNLGPKDGFEPIPERIVEFPSSASMDQVAMAIDKLLI